jgi:hypothetical protein
MNRSMEVDRSFDNVPFNDNDSDDEESEDNEILFVPEVQPNVIVFEPEEQLGRPIRNRNIPSRFMRTQTPPPPIRNHRRNPLNNPQVNVIPPINNVLMNNPQFDVIAPNNPQVNVVPRNRLRNNALRAVNNLLNSPMNINQPVVILSNEEKNARRKELETALSFAASGHVPEIDLIDQPSIRDAIGCQK